jgi:hypothetical protein
MSYISEEDTLHRIVRRHMCIMLAVLGVLVAFALAAPPVAAAGTQTGGAGSTAQSRPRQHKKCYRYDHGRYHYYKYCYYYWYDGHHNKHYFKYELYYCHYVRHHRKHYDKCWYDDSNDDDPGPPDPYKEECDHEHGSHAAKGTVSVLLM